MRNRHLLLGLVALLGIGVSSLSPAAAAGTRQCYYRAGIDPPTACTGCANSCLGAGYLCCDIVVG